MKQFEFIYKDDLVQAIKEANEEMKELQDAGAEIISMEAGVHPIPYSAANSSTGVVMHEVHYSFLIVYSTKPVLPVEPHKRGG